MPARYPFKRCGVLAVLPASSTPNAAYCRRFDGDLVLDTVPTYISVIGIADERWKASAARNRRHRFMLLTTDVLALVCER
jgi:hypothetical protein